MSTLFVASEDFILSREAMLCSPETIHFFQRMPLSISVMTNARSRVPHTLRIVFTSSRLSISIRFGLSQGIRMVIGSSIQLSS